MENQSPVKGPKVIVLQATSRMGTIYARVLNRLGSLAALVDSNEPEMLSQLSTVYNVPQYHLLDDCLQKVKPIDAIVIAGRIDNVIETIDKILVAKPKVMLLAPHITSDLEDLEKITAKAKKASCKLLIGLIENHNPVIKRMMLLINQGVIGDVRSILIERQGAVPMQTLSEIGNVFFDIGLHDFNLALQLIGNEVDISAHMTKISDIPNTATITMKNNEKLVTILLSREYAGKKRRIEIEGTKATMFADLLTRKLEFEYLGIARGEEQSITVHSDEGSFIIAYGEPIEQEIWDLLDCISNKGRLPLVSPIQLVNALKVAEAALRSSQNHCRVHLKLSS